MKFSDLRQGSHSRPPALHGWESGGDCLRKAIRRAVTQPATCPERGRLSGARAAVRSAAADALGRVGGIGASAASAEEEPPSAEEEPPSAEEEVAGGDLRHDPERANRAAAGWGRAGGRLSDGGLFLSS